MKNHIRVVLVAIGLTLATTACDRGKAEAERKAAEAEKQAQETTITAARMQAEAEEAAKSKRAHVEARTKVQKDFEAYERKATYLKEKAAKTVGTTKKNADAAINELASREAKAKASLSKLADDAAPAWDETKKTAEDDVAAVGKAVEALEHTITK
ncbi:MAG TPA: hypothetical protein VM925_14695 [Labilithrix sp.]|jgi:hypothetical protein|nr:hypothetical protein [Labilithrix sp.]